MYSPVEMRERKKDGGRWRKVGAKTAAEEVDVERSAKSYTKFIISQRYNVCRDSAEV
jgi:hypothetical protein